MKQATSRFFVRDFGVLLLVESALAACCRYVMAVGHPECIFSCNGNAVHEPPHQLINQWLMQALNPTKTAYLLTSV